MLDMMHPCHTSGGNDITTEWTYEPFQSYSNYTQHVTPGILCPLYISLFFLHVMVCGVANEVSASHPLEQDFVWVSVIVHLSVWVRLWMHLSCWSSPVVSKGSVIHSYIMTSGWVVYIPTNTRSDDVTPTLTFQGCVIILRWYVKLLSQWHPHGIISAKLPYYFQ